MTEKTVKFNPDDLEVVKEVIRRAIFEIEDLRKSGGSLRERANRAYILEGLEYLLHMLEYNAD